MAAAASVLGSLPLQVRRYASSSRLVSVEYRPWPSACRQPKAAMAASRHQEAAGHRLVHAVAATTVPWEAGVAAVADEVWVVRRITATSKGGPDKWKPKLPKEGPGGGGGIHHYTSPMEDPSKRNPKEGGHGGSSGDPELKEGNGGDGGIHHYTSPKVDPSKKGPMEGGHEMKEGNGGGGGPHH